MKDLLAFLEGNKSYLVGGLMAATSAAYGFDMISEGVFTVAMTLLTGGGVVTLRHGMKTDALKVKEEVKQEVRLESMDVKQDVREVKQEVREATQPPTIIR